MRTQSSTELDFTFIPEQNDFGTKLAYRAFNSEPLAPPLSFVYLRMIFFQFNCVNKVAHRQNKRAALTIGTCQKTKETTHSCQRRGNTNSNINIREAEGGLRETRETRGYLSSLGFSRIASAS